MLKRWWHRALVGRFRAEYAEKVRVDVWSLSMLYQYTPVPFRPTIEEGNVDASAASPAH